MSLFAILGLPCLTLFLLLSAEERRNTLPGKKQLPLIEFLKGFFYAVPALVVTLLVRRYVPLSYRTFALYLIHTAIDHLIAAVFLLLLWFLLYAGKSFDRLLPFAGGFYTLVGIVEIFIRYGQYEPYHLFLLPLLRMAALLFLTVFFLKYQEWYGVVRVLYAVLMVAVPLLSGAITLLYMHARLLWALLFAAVFFLGSLVYTFAERRG